MKYHLYKFRHILILSIAFTFIFLSPSLNAQAVQAENSLREFKQPDNVGFQAKIQGDEWFNWIEDEQNNVLIKNVKDNFWYYAIRSPGGENMVSAAKAAIDKSPSNALKSKDIKPAHINNRPAQGTLFIEKEPSKAALNPSEPILVILIEFDDKYLSSNESTWNTFFFGTTGKTVRTYYNEVSYNQFDFVPAAESYGTANNGIIKIHLDYRHPNTGGTLDYRNQQIVKDALIAANSYIDFQAYDTNHDGYISSGELHISTVIAGYEGSIYGYYTPSVWSHWWALNQVSCPSLDGVVLGDYNHGGSYTQFGESHGTHLATIGNTCHELGHDLGLPDLYDTAYNSLGVGPHCLMGSGNWGTSVTDSYQGSTPSHLSAWSKIDAGFANPLVAASGQYVLNASEQDNYNILKFQTENPNQYFLFENRQFEGFDAGLASSCDPSKGGIAIWHIDESIIEINRDSNTINNNPLHKGVDIEEASGNELDQNESGYESYVHYYLNGGNKNFGPGSYPNNSDLYDGGGSGLDVDILSTPGAEMNISIFEAAVPDFVILSENAECDTTLWTISPEGKWSRTSNKAYTGIYSWSPANENNADYTFTSPSFDLTGRDAASITFNHWYSLESGFDHGYLLISSDNGIKWTALKTFNGQSADWIKETINLSSYVGYPEVRVRFKIYSDNSITSTGWFIDDIEVKVDATLGINSVTADKTSPQTAPVTVRWTCDADGPEGLQYAWYVYKDGTKVYTKWYSTSDYIDYTCSEAGSYKVLAFAKAPDDSKVSKYSSVIVVETGVTLAINSVTADKTSPQTAPVTVRWTCDADGPEGLQYAWYVYKDGTKVYTKWYSTSDYIDYTCSEAGSYKVLAFAKAPDGTKDSQYSGAIVVEEPVPANTPSAADETGTVPEADTVIETGLGADADPDIDPVLDLETNLEIGTGSSPEQRRT